MNLDKLQKLQAQVRIGGKGTPRRKVKKTQKASTGGDDKKLTLALKKFNLQPIPAIEEVNMFKADGRVIHVQQPKVHASIASSMFVITGHAEDKHLNEMIPGILSQLGPENLATLRNLAESYQQQESIGKHSVSADDDEIPELVENFEKIAAEDVE